MAQQIQDRQLNQRAFITFEFWDSKGLHERILPFYENVTVTESKSANYITYKPISRSSPLFAYSGAEARKVELTFSITLPHILAYSDKNLYKQTNAVDDGNEYFKSLFFFKQKNGFINDSIQISNKIIPKIGSAKDFDNFYLNELGIDVNSNESSARKKCIDIIMYWVALIRSSVLSNQEEPIYGPPTVRLTYGILYKDVPFICTDYSIDEDPVAGMDNRTLLPRKINVKMSLLENRTHNFGKFYPGDQYLGDNNSGWEIIFDERVNADPAFNLIDPNLFTPGGFNG